MHSSVAASANVNGGRLGVEVGGPIPNPALGTGPAQSRAQDANLHDTRFDGP